MAELELRNISKYFGANRVIDSLSLSIKSGEFLTLLGPSGCGKTTILRMIAGLESIDEGDLYIGGRHCNHIPAQRRPIAMVFQSYALFPHMSVRDNILFGLKIAQAGHDAMREKLEWVIPLLGLGGMEDRLPKEISGGQRQRVALARALVLEPQVLLLDEPLSNLDAALRDTAMEELKRVHRQVGKTIIYVTHNQTEAMVMSERIAVLHEGRLEQCDTPMAVYDRPRTLFSAEFVGSPKMNLIEGEVARHEAAYGIKTSSGFFRIDTARENRMGAWEGKKVRAGIRPQHIISSAQIRGRRYSDTSLMLNVELVEPLGDRSLLVGRAGNGTVFRFLASRDEEIVPDQQITVFIDGRKVHLFNPLTLENMFNEDGQEG